VKKIYLSGEVGWEITPREVRRQLEEAKGEDVTVFANSPGGLVSDALEIFNLFRNYEGKKTIVLSGFAMSCMSYIPLAFDRVQAEDNAVYMIHNVHGGVWGDHNDILDYGAMCKGLSGMFASAYAKFTNKKVADISAMMDSTTFFYGQQIVDAGFAHELIQTDQDQDSTAGLAKAKLAFQELTSKMSADQQALKKDLNRASALALGDINRPNEATNKTEKNIMTLAELKAKFPELVAEIVKEATQGTEAKLQAAKAEGAQQELNRIKSVQEQSFPGHESIVLAAMFDGKSQAGDVAMAINTANIQALQKAGTDMSTDAPSPVDEPLNNGEIMKNPTKQPSTEAEARALWDKSANLQQDFMSFEDYYAFSKKDNRFNVRVSGGVK
jgi:ATP-dependent protease ClpP protease subunit